MPPAHSPDETPAAPCVWMSAGLLRYKLCDRDFDCEHCPLDAALCGRRGVGGGAGFGAGGPVWFPADRLYTAGHLWLGDGDGVADGVAEDGAVRRVRVGVDSFAAALLGGVRGVRAAAPGTTLAAGAPLCRLELAAGELTVGAPVDGRCHGLNPLLAADPRRLRREPYDAGWLVEMSLAPGAVYRRGGPGGFLTAAGARRQASCDLRHFRRRVALLLLADDDRLGPTLPDGGEIAVDVPGLLGPRRHLGLLRELVH